MMIKVWTDEAEAGLLERTGERGSTFAYFPDSLGRPRRIRHNARAPSVLECALRPASHF